MQPGSARVLAIVEPASRKMPATPPERWRDGFAQWCWIRRARHPQNAWKFLRYGDNVPCGKLREPGPGCPLRISGVLKGEWIAADAGKQTELSLACAGADAQVETVWIRRDPSLRCHRPSLLDCSPPVRTA